MSRRAAPHRGLDTHYGDAEDGRPSKTELKRQSLQLQVLGQQLADLPADALARAPIDEPLREAIAELQRTRSHEGRRRQLQFVGKLMRGADEAALREALAAATVGSARETLRLHEIERWRAQLIADDGALTAWMAEHPGTDAQRLRSLVRAARRDATSTGPADGQAARQPRSYRELFQFLKPFVDSSGTAAPDTEADPDSDPDHE